MAKWTECGNEFSAHGSGINVTMTAKGRIRLGRGATARLGDPEAVKVLFDKANNTIGLESAKRGAKNAFVVTRDADRRGRYVNAYRLTTEFGIRLKETVYFPDAAIDTEGILVLDLRSARPSERAKAAKRWHAEKLSGLDVYKAGASETVTAPVGLLKETGDPPV